MLFTIVRSSMSSDLVVPFLSEYTTVAVISEVSNASPIIIWVSMFVVLSSRDIAPYTFIG